MASSTLSRSARVRMGASNDQSGPSRRRRMRRLAGAAVCRLKERTSKSGMLKIVSARSWSRVRERLSARLRPTTWMRSPSGESTYRRLPTLVVSPMRRVTVLSGAAAHRRARRALVSPAVNVSVSWGLSSP